MVISLKKINIKSALIITLVTISVFNTEIKSVSAVTEKSNYIKEEKIILVDPGHGGMDGGAESKSGTVEKSINLNIGLKLKKILENEKFNVIMTREKDKGLYTEGGTIRKKKLEDLNNRCEMKEKSNCDMFVSIHLNMFPESKYYGAQVWYSENQDSKRLAHIIQENLRKDLDNNNKRIEKQALGKYKILRAGKDVPSVIVECGFLSNYEEEQKLKDESYQQKIAESLGKSIEEYYTE